MTAAVWFAARHPGEAFVPGGVWRALQAAISGGAVSGPADSATGAAGRGVFGAVGRMDGSGSSDWTKGDWTSRRAKPAASKRNTPKQKAAAEQAAIQIATAAERELETDWTDIAATLDGDGQAYARIVRRYQDQITAQMWRLSRQRNDCEQLVHEVFVEAYMSLRQFKGRAPFLHWLRKIATRVGYRYWKQQARARRQAAVPLQDWHRSVPAVEAGEAEEAAALVHGMLDKLPPRDRLVLTLIYLEECSVAEAAELSGWSQTMVKVQAHRARKKLKKLLEEANPT
ncbi:MAG TPA: RNA polymerase sigma factor [Pirellulales bacterium]|nr:RNA polymerase sigma factor [Pirellulales bacterium]